MGATMLTAIIAFPAESTEPPNFDRGRQLLEGITDASLFTFEWPEAELDELLLPDLDDESDLVDENGEVLIEYARRAGLVIINNLEEALDSRETTFLTVADYRLYISGGLSNGGTPTDATQAPWDVDKLPESVVLAMGFIPDFEQPLSRANSREVSTPLTDTDVVDAIALGLGTSPEWPGTDTRKWNAEAIGKVRDEPGNAEPVKYLKRWSERYGFDPLSSKFLSAYIDEEIGKAGEEESEDRQRPARPTTRSTLSTSSSTTSKRPDTTPPRPPLKEFGYLKRTREPIDKGIFRHEQVVCNDPEFQLREET